MKNVRGSSILLALVLSSASAVASAATVIGDIMFSGGLTPPNAPVSIGSSLYDNGDIVYYRNYQDPRANTAIVVGHLSVVQVQKLLNAGADLTAAPIVRDETAPRCLDAPYEAIQILNRFGQMITISDKSECRAGHRADWAGAAESAFLEGLNSVASYGHY